MAEKFDYELFCLVAEKNRREAEKKQKALRSLTDEQLDALIGAHTKPESNVSYIKKGERKC